MKAGFWTTLAATALTGMPLAGCGNTNGTAAGKTEVVASLNSLRSLYMVNMRRQLEQAAKDAGISLTILDGQGDSGKQTADIQAAAVRGAKVIILAPNDPKSLMPAVDDLHRDGVSVIAIDRRLEGTAEPTPFVAADNVAGGRLQAGWVVKHFPKGARVVVITNEVGVSSMIDRLKGVKQGLAAGGPQYRIVSQQAGDSSRELAQTITQNILTSMSNNLPDAIITFSDDMALGAAEAIHDANLPAGKVPVIGFDATPEGLAQIRDGGIAGQVDQRPAAQAKQAITEAVALLRSGKTPTSVAVTPVLITRENLTQAERYGEINAVARK